MAGPDLGPNLVAMFDATAGRLGELPFLWAKGADKAWHSWSWARVQRESRELAATLVDAGLAAGDRVLLVSENRPEWCIADLAIMRAGGVTVPAYTTNTSDDHRYLLEHSGARLVVCSGAGLARALMPAVAQVPAVRLVLFMDPTEGWSVPTATIAPWSEALRRGAALAPVDLAAELGPDDLACLIYTSGTGGRPKGVMLSHRNIQANLRGAWRLLEELGLDGSVFLSFLPLSHAYEHTAGQCLPMALGAQVYYAEGVESLSANLVETRPTLLTCVPRLYEVLRQRILHGVERQGGFRARLFHLALDLGRRRYEQGGLPPHLAVVDRLLEPLVRDKVRARFGGRLKALISGGAPLNYDVGLFFTALGLPVAQGYGQTEAAPLISVNPPARARLDTVGPPVEGVELRIAEDGEILVRGEMVMPGYWKDPDATAATVRDGWLHTGDIGELDERGYLRITDRKKDMIVLSGGDNVAPQRVEGIMLLEGEIAQIAVFGDKRAYAVGLVVPSAELVKTVAREAGRDADLAQLSEHEALRKRVAAAVARGNAKLSPTERVRRFAVLPEACTVENGMMTPTLKLKRHVVRQRYQGLLDGLYGPDKVAEKAAG
ncbi:MAG: long-chain fatty acid--CoA ligase [Geminicoccaceae bacterium]